MTKPDAAGAWRAFCPACWDAELARSVPRTHASLSPVRLVDAAGATHEFAFTVRELGPNVAIDAWEPACDPGDGHEFQVLSDGLPNDLAPMFAQLVARMRRALAQRHLEDEPDVGLQITHPGIVRGRLVAARADEGELPGLVVDGRHLSWNELGRILSTWQGFHLRLDVFDKSIER